jgi:hypothetical protein
LTCGGIFPFGFLDLKVASRVKPAFLVTTALLQNLFPFSFLSYCHFLFFLCSSLWAKSALAVFEHVRTFFEKKENTKRHIEVISAGSVSITVVFALCLSLSLSLSLSVSVSLLLVLHLNGCVGVFSLSEPKKVAAVKPSLLAASASSRPVAAFAASSSVDAR